MRSTVLYVAVAAATLIVSCQGSKLSDEQYKKLHEHHEKCRASTGVKIELVEGLSKGSFPEDPTLKTYMACVFKELTMMDDKGAFNFQILKNNLPKDFDVGIAVKIIEKCKGTEGTDLDDKAFKMYKCFYDNNPDHVEFPL